MPGALSATVIAGLRCSNSSNMSNTDVSDVACVPGKLSRFEAMASRLSASDQELLDHEMMNSMHRIWKELYNKCAA